MNDILRILHITKTYVMGDTTFQALQDVTFTIKKGEFVAIMGPSGSGKSTLMHIIGCLDRPSDGSIFLDGTDIAHVSDVQLAAIRNKHIGFVFQQFNLLRRTSALSNVELPLIYAKLSTKERRIRAQKSLEDVGLATKMNNIPSQLSGGQQQRVAIARALVTNPSILLADEPTGNLDSKSGEDIMRIIETLHRTGKTVILVTHDEQVASRARRIIRIADGRIVKDSGKAR